MLVEQQSCSCEGNHCMAIPQEMPGSHNTLEMTRARPNDVGVILALLDEAVVWLVRNGLEKQWGTTPFSELPRMRERLVAWIDQGILFTARSHDQLVGTLVVSETAPEYVAHLWQSFPTSAFYLEAFMPARSRAGQGIGQVALQWAAQSAIQANKTTLWLDCWAEDHPLCASYEHAGFMTQGGYFVCERLG